MSRHCFHGKNRSWPEKCGWMFKHVWQCFYKTAIQQLCQTWPKVRSYVLIENGLHPIGVHSLVSVPKAKFTDAPSWFTASLTRLRLNLLRQEVGGVRVCTHRRLHTSSREVFIGTWQTWSRPLRQSFRLQKRFLVCRKKVKLSEGRRTIKMSFPQCSPQ